jgi:Protein of unknown function (DUF1460)
MGKRLGLILFAGTLLTAAAVHLVSQAEVKQPVIASVPLVVRAVDPVELPSLAPVASPSTEEPMELALAAADPKFEPIMQWAKQNKLAQRSLPEIVQAVSEQFVGATYRDHLLDQTSAETLFVSLKEFDCVLFVETVLALSRSIAIADYTYPTFTQNLQAQRYRHGEMDGYCSRLHYWSEWIQDNADRNGVTDLSATLGGVPLNKPLNFMSRHWQKYPQLLNSPANRQCIQDMEVKLDAIPIRYIPHQQIASLYPKLQPGDIVAITTDQPGLDATHTGLVYRTANGGIGLIHAAPNAGVKMSTDLQTYVDRLGATGILVARPIDARQP